MRFSDQAPRVGADCFVARNATLIGDVTMGEKASVWFNTVLRGDVEPIVIGARTNIQDGAVLHTDPGTPLIIGSDVTVGHMAMLHGCTIGDGSLIGIGAIVLSGASIGKSCIVGAGALVTEGMVFPDRTVVLGTPAKVVRPVTDEQAVAIRASAAHYVANAARYRRNGAPLGDADAEIEGDEGQLGGDVLSNAQRSLGPSTFASE